MQVTIHKLDSQQADSALMLQRLRSRLLDSLCPQKLRKTERLRKLVKRMAALEQNVGREQAECVKVMEAVLATVERNGQVAEAVCHHLGSRKREAMMPSMCRTGNRGSCSPFSSSASLVGQLGRMLGAARTEDSERHALGLPAGTMSAKTAEEDAAASAAIQRLHVDNAPVPARLEETDLPAEESAGPSFRATPEIDQGTVSSMEGTSAEGLDAQLLLYMSRFRSVWDAPTEPEELPQAALPASSRRADEAVRRLVDVSVSPPKLAPPDFSLGPQDSVFQEPSPNESQPGTSNPGKPVSDAAAGGDDANPDPGPIAVRSTGHSTYGHQEQPAQSPQGDIAEEPNRPETEGQAEEAEARAARPEPALEQPAPVSVPRGGPLVRRVTSSEEEGSSSPDSGSSADSLAKAKAAPKERPRHDSRDRKSVV